MSDTYPRRYWVGTPTNQLIRCVLELESTPDLPAALAATAADLRGEIAHRLGRSLCCTPEMCATCTDEWGHAPHGRVLFTDGNGVEGIGRINRLMSDGTTTTFTSDGGSDSGPVANFTILAELCPERCPHCGARCTQTIRHDGKHISDRYEGTASFKVEPESW